MYNSFVSNFSSCFTVFKSRDFLFLQIRIVKSKFQSSVAYESLTILTEFCVQKVLIRSLNNIEN